MAARGAAAVAYVATELVPREPATHNVGEDMEDVDDPVVSYVEHTTVAPSYVEAGPRFEDAIGGLVDDFFDRTAQLAMQNNFIQANQCNQAAAQNAALMAVKASAESDVQRLAAFHELSKAEMHTFLESTREAMRNDIMKLVQMQQQTGAEIQTSLTARIAESFQAAQREALAAQHMAYNQAQRNDQVSATVEDLRSRLDAVVTPASTETIIASRVQAATSQLERGLSTKLQDMVSEAVENAALTGSKGRVTPQRVHIIANRAVQDAEARLEEKLQCKLAKATEDAASDAASRDKAAAKMLHDSVSAEVMDAEARLEAKLQERLIKAQKAHDVAIEKQVQTTEQLAVDLTLMRTDLADKINALNSRMDKLEEKSAMPTITRPVLSPLLKREPVAQQSTAPLESPAEDATTRRALSRVVTDAVEELTSLIDLHLRSSKPSARGKGAVNDVVPKKPAAATAKKNVRVTRSGPNKLTGAKFREAVAAKEQELIRLRADAAASRRGPAA